MAVIDVVNYDAIDSGLNPNGLHLVSIAGIDRVAKRGGAGLIRLIVPSATGAGRHRDRHRPDPFPAFPGRGAALANGDRRDECQPVIPKHARRGASMASHRTSAAGPGWTAWFPRTPIGTTVPGLWLTSSHGGFRRLHRSHATGMLAGPSRNEVATYAGRLTATATGPEESLPAPARTTRPPASEPITGDCLFPGGLGRVTKPDEFDSLYRDVTNRVFDVYPDSTVVYPGHGDDTRCWVPSVPISKSGANC